MSIQEKKQELIALISGTNNEVALDWMTEVLSWGLSDQEDASSRERFLLRKINEDLAPEQQQRYAELMLKASLETLTEAELAEYQTITAQAESAQASRILFLRELARMRSQSIDEVMEDLGIIPSENVIS